MRSQGGQDKGHLQRPEEEDSMPCFQNNTVIFGNKDQQRRHPRKAGKAAAGQTSLQKNFLCEAVVPASLL